MKRFTMDEIIARRMRKRQKIMVMSETCRKQNCPALQKLGVIRREGKKNTGIWVILENAGFSEPKND